MQGVVKSMGEMDSNPMMITRLLNTRSVPNFGALLILSVFLLLPSGLRAQTPRINTFYPIGGRIGTTVDLEIRGANLVGANKLIVHGAGVTGSVQPSVSKSDEAGKPAWQSKCGTCHDLRSPSNRSLTPEQWVATVERMIKVRNAPISPAESDKIKQFLAGAARSGKLTASVKISNDAIPGIYEMRVVTPVGVSSAALFEVGNLPEITAGNNTRNTPTAITLPCIINGSINPVPGGAERHYFRFQGKSGERIVFNLKAFRYNFLTELFFNPNIRIYDSTGTEIAENHGYYDLDPLLDWRCPASGAYTLEVRDLLGRGNPGNVYRLTIGSVPYDTMLFPPAVEAGNSANLRVVGKATDGFDTSFTQPSINSLGITSVGSPFGSHPLLVSGFPIVTHDKTTMVPACLTGQFNKMGETDHFRIEGSGAYEFEVYSERLGSLNPVRAHIKNEKGQIIANIDRDNRTRATIPAGKAYSLEVEPEESDKGVACVYAVEVRPVHPVAEVAVRPANITVRPGMTTPVEVVLLRREGVTGDITISAEDLPSGVIVTPAIIQPDRNEATLLLTGLSTAAVSEKPITVTVSAQGPAGEIRTTAKPQEIVLVQNTRTPINRVDCVLAVRGASDFTGEATSGKVVKVHPRKGVKVTIKVNRKANFKGAVNVAIRNLPLGWVANQEQIPADKDTVTLLVRPDGNNTLPFLNRDVKLTPIRAVVEMGADEYMFVVDTLLINRADNINEKDDDKKE